jgi:hypothetical protein
MMAGRQNLMKIKDMPNAPDRGISATPHNTGAVFSLLNQGKKALGRIVDLYQYGRRPRG